TFYAGTGRYPADVDVLNPSGPPCASCVVDQRPRKCGDCVRDCFETGGPGFEECGVGVRVTSLLTAVLVDGGVESKVSTPVGERPKYLGQHGQGTFYGAVKKLGVNMTVSQIGGYWHALQCPCDFTPGPLPERIPGIPVNACITGKAAHPFSAWAPGGFYAPVFTKCNWPTVPGVDVCNGFAFDFPGDHNGFIHVKKGRQQIFSGQRRSSPTWLLSDMVLAMLVMMKLAEARVVPLFCLAMWWYVNGALTASITIIHVNVTQVTHPSWGWTVPTVKPLPCPNSTTGLGDSVSNAACFAGSDLWLGVGGAWSALSGATSAVASWVGSAYRTLHNVGLGVRWLASVGSYLPTVEAALAPELVCAPVVGWGAQESWFVGFLAVCCVVAYLGVLGTARCCVLVAMHFARG
nr:putative E2 protein [Pegivirus platyrrhini]